MNFIIIAVAAMALVNMASAEATNAQLFSDGSAKFTAKFFSEVVKSNPGKSVVMSAYSVEYPLAQLALGAQGSTAKELYAAIGLSDEKALREVLPAEQQSLRTIPGVDLKLASKLFVHSDYKLKPAFEQASRDVFNSEVQQIDVSKPEASANTVNSWVEAQTNNRIKDLVKPDTITPETRLLLVNAIYFKGSWKTKFDSKLTQDRDFYITPSKTVQVPMMFRKDRFKYGESQTLDAKLLELFYEGEKASFLVILPNKKDGLEELQTKLQDVDLVEKELQHMFFTEVHVSLPKFKIETETDLKLLLPKLGVSEIFDSLKANLSNMLTTEQNLVVSEAKQKAFIEVNEEGAEAAAANEFGFVATSAFIEPKPIVFLADHPFTFFLRHGVTRLFEGNVIEIK